MASSGQNKNSNSDVLLGDVFLTLQGIGLDNHFTYIFKKGVNYESFTNVTEDDMRYLGITKPEEQSALLSALNNLKIPYSESVEIERLDVEYILEDTVKAFRRLRTNMLRQIKELENCQKFDPMIDSRTRTIPTLKEVLNIMKQGTDRLEKRLLPMFDCLTEDPITVCDKMSTIWKTLQKRCLLIAMETMFYELGSLVRDVFLWK